MLCQHTILTPLIEIDFSIIYIYCLNQEKTFKLRRLGIRKGIFDYPVARKFIFKLFF